MKAKLPSILLASLILFIQTPSNGAWNMVDKRFYQPADINGWVVVIYEVQSRFHMGSAREMIQGLIAACKEVGTSYSLKSS